MTGQITSMVTMVRTLTLTRTEVQPGEGLDLTQSHRLPLAAGGEQGAQGGAAVVSRTGRMEAGPVLVESTSFPDRLE